MAVEGTRMAHKPEGLDLGVADSALFICLEHELTLEIILSEYMAGGWG